jgi:hypothetical protein
MDRRPGAESPPAADDGNDGVPMLDEDDDTLREKEETEAAEAGDTDAAREPESPDSGQA